MFIVLSIATLVFSGWRFYMSAASAGKNIETKIGMAAAGVAAFMALITWLPRIFRPILRSDAFDVYQEPNNYLFFLACSVLIFVIALLLGVILKSLPPRILSDSQADATEDVGAAGSSASRKEALLDRTIRATAICWLIAGGVGGGMGGWGGAADGLPFIMWLITLPALAIWFGRRSATVPGAVIQGGIFGAAFVIPSYLFYLSSNMIENISALMISMIIPGVVAVIAHATRGEPITTTSTEEQLKARAQKLTTTSLVGILLPQIVQPAVYDTVRAFDAAANANAKADIKKLVGLPAIISCTLLVLLIAMSAVTIFAAVGDAL